MAASAGVRGGNAGRGLTADQTGGAHGVIPHAVAREGFEREGEGHGVVGRPVGAIDIGDSEGAERHDPLTIEVQRFAAGGKHAHPRPRRIASRHPDVFMSMIPPQLRNTLARPIIGIRVIPASITCSTIGRFPREA